MKKKLQINFGELGILYALLIFWLILIAFSPNFRNISAFQNIVREASFTGICGVGMTFVIISGDLDLSVASQVALCSCVLTLLLPKMGVFPSVILILLLGAVLGTFNGVLIAKMKIPAFIATLAMMFGYRALAQIVNATPVVVENRLFKLMSTSYLAGIPVPFIIMIICGVIGTVILRKTALGRHTLAIGNSHEAARIAGISIPRTQILIYLMVGLFTAAASIMITSYLGSSNYGMKDGFEFTVISAVVLGGTALVGGKGSIFTTAVAAIFLATIKSGMDAFQIQSYMQRIIEGVILIFAFSINGIRAYVNDFLVKSRSRRELDERRRGSAAGALKPRSSPMKEGCVPALTCSSCRNQPRKQKKRLGDGLFMLKKTRILALVLCFAMAISLAACSSDSGTAPAPSTAAPAAPAAPPTKRPPRPRLKPPASNSAGRSTTTSRNSSRA